MNRLVKAAWLINILHVIAALIVYFVYDFVLWGVFLVPVAISIWLYGSYKNKEKIVSFRGKRKMSDMFKGFILGNLCALIGTIISKLIFH